jgi:hypothetical protein
MISTHTNTHGQHICVRGYAPAHATASLEQSHPRRTRSDARRFLEPQRINQPIWVPGDVGQSVEEEGLEGTPAPRSSGGDLTRPAEVGEGVRNGLGIRSPHRCEASDYRGRSTTASDEAAHERVSVGDG